MSNHKFPYKWYLKNGYPSAGIEAHGKKVFGTFICGGGSTMGYKLAGYTHLGGVEFDPKISKVYQENHHPKFLFTEDIREFNKRNDIPKELFNIDLLDGSPPCSSFSMAGNRDKDWGKKKQFREGQAFQRLDDLVFEYIKTISILQPKVALLENVKGLITGNAKAYAKNMKIAFEQAGYRVQVFLLNAASMGVPQKRERVFFIGLRNDIKLPLLKLEFNEAAIPFCEVMVSENGKPVTGKMLELWEVKRPGEKSLAAACLRETGKGSYFGSTVIDKNDVCMTIIASGSSPILHDHKPFELHDNELKQVGTYPMDYNFTDIEPKYLIGMSVPPVMTAQISHQIFLQWLSKTN